MLYVLIIANPLICLESRKPIYCEENKDLCSDRFSYNHDLRWRYIEHRPSSKYSFPQFHLHKSTPHLVHSFTHDQYENWKCVDSLDLIWPLGDFKLSSCLSKMISVKALCRPGKGDLCAWASFRVVTMMKGHPQWRLLFVFITKTGRTKNYSW